jgi:ATP-dependent DNA helicase RecQ
MSTTFARPLIMKPKPVPSSAKPTVLETIRRYWGFSKLRPLQAEAIDAALSGRDSLVVLPTGGGKSLCFQVPPVVGAGTDVVISPLISLMKDQVDGLRECGYPAAAIYSGIEGDERRQMERDLVAGKYRLLFVAPERAVTGWLAEIARRLDVRRFAIDEAHCISHWGHDFRPEYRQLASLREKFPQASLHAFTATATPRVRDDIARQLGLREPAVLVGSFDRPNLTYRVLPQIDVYAQSIGVIRRHPNEAVIVYCISRKDTEHMAETLKANSIAAEAYHAGLDPQTRHRVQDAFSAEQLNVVVATVAFGMGIDRSNVRCVLHTAMPKSIEHYQQETGRAGRDGLPAECVLLYSYGDAMKWESLFAKNAQETSSSPEVFDAQTQLLKQMQRFCNSANCRHRALVEYFGQTYDADKCGACDVCLTDVEGIEDGTVTAQKILSCVARVEERFGAGHVADVLIGADTEMIRNCRHDQLSTYGLLRDVPKKQLQSIVFQLVDQGLLDRTLGDRPVLKLNDESWKVLRGQRGVRLIKPKEESLAKSKADVESWESVDRGLFEHLRKWRQGVAAEHRVPPFVIFHDSVLRGLARVRPSKKDMLRQVPGIGERKLADFGQRLLELIHSFCSEHHLSTDQTQAEPAAIGYVKSKSKSAAKAHAFELFRKGWPLDDVKHKLDRARSTVTDYLQEYITDEKPRSIKPWVSDEAYKQITAAAAKSEDCRLTPIFERLDGRVPYDVIRLVLSHLQVTADLNRHE